MYKKNLFLLSTPTEVAFYPSLRILFFCNLFEQNLLSLPSATGCGILLNHQITAFSCSLNKTRNTNDEISASRKQDFPSQTTTNDLRRIKVLQTLLNFLSLHPYQNWKQVHILPSQKAIHRLMIWFFDLRPIWSLMYTHFSSPQTM